AVSGEYKRSVNGLLACLNHERFIPEELAKGPFGAGTAEWGDDADGFEVDFCGSRGDADCGWWGGIAGATDDPRRMDHSSRGIQILDDAPAAGISRPRQDLQYRMDPVPGHHADDLGAGCWRA